MTDERCLLDVHVLVSDRTPRAHVRQCVESVLAAIRAAPYLVALHIMPGIAGHIGAARERAHQQGNADYTTYVDDDDWVAPEAFAILHPHLEAGVSGVTTGEVFVTGEHHRRVPDGRHHLMVTRRDLMPYIGDTKFFPDKQLLQAVTDRIHIPQCVYFHRLDADSNSRRQRAEAGTEATRAEAEKLRLERRSLRAEEMSKQDIEQIYQEEGL